MILVKTQQGIKQSTLAEAKTTYNKFKGWHCGAGIDFLWISNKGEVFGNVCRKSGSYGNVFKEFTLPKGPMICPTESCYCASDINILKSKNIKDFKSLKDLGSNDLPKYNGEEILAVESVNKEFAINWNLGPRCNYDCSYCPATVHDNYSPHVTFSEFKQAFDKVLLQIGKQDLLKLTFTGGEPTINPEYMKIADYVVSKGGKVFTNTNGTASIDKLKKLCNYGGVYISVHTEFYQQRKLASKLSQLAEQQGTCVVKYMLVPGKLEACRTFINMLPKSQGSYRISVEPLVDKSNNNKMLEYTQEELEYLREPK